MDENYSMNDYIEVQQIYEQNPFPITAATFDTQQELLWAGTSEGRVTSYYGFGLSKYTSFKVQNDSEVRVIHSARDRDAIFVLNADLVSGYTRCGVNIFRHKDTSFHNLQCMYLNQHNRFYLGGYTDKIFDFDIERLKILRQVSIDEKDCILMKHSPRGYLCTGSTSGQINIRDQFTMKSIHVLHPHNGSLSDFDVHGNYLVTCGFSSRLGSLCIDRFLMVYDLRVMKVMNPVQLVIEPCFIHYIPMCSSVVAIASQSGCFQLTDTNVSTPSPYCQLYQAQVPPVGLCTTFLLSDTCNAVAFGHSTGSIHLFSKGENAAFNPYSMPTLFVDPTPTMGPYFDINDEITPLSSVPVPITNENPLSDWPKSWCTYEYRPTLEISEELTSNARIIHGITSVQNKFDIKRNQINEKYVEQLIKMKERSKVTSMSIEEMMNEQATLATVVSEVTKSESKNEPPPQLSDEKEEPQVEIKEETIKQENGEEGEKNSQNETEKSASNE